LTTYYNEIDPAAAAILRHLVAIGVITPGDVDTRSIKDVHPDDLRDYTQCHFFAGGGLWSVAARMAGWADDRPLWTGSCPCQPFSAAGKGGGADDPRHLWPDFHRLIRACRPPVVVGEQVAGSAGYGWLDGVRADLAGENYASRGVDIPACAVDAPHQRNRLYWVAMEHAARLGRREGRPEHELRGGRSAASGADASSHYGCRNGSNWAGADWITCHDGKARRAKPGLRLLVDGLPGRVDLWRVGGNAIVPVEAAEVLAALLETEARTYPRRDAELTWEEMLQ
jgi:DNA (cytosine-5)-methyltransferase 1